VKTLKFAAGLVLVIGGLVVIGLAFCLTGETPAGAAPT
jgi:hypothetical protein